MRATVAAPATAFTGVALVVLAFLGGVGPALRPAAGVLVVVVLGLAWALWRERIALPPSVRARAVVVALLVWAISLATEVMRYGPDGFDTAALVIGTLLATASWWPLFGAVAVYVRTAASPVPVAPEPPRADPEAHLSPTERRLHARALRIDEPLDTVRDRDGRHAPARVLRIEVIGWAGAGGAFFVLNLATRLVGVAPWWAVAPTVVACVALLALAERLLGLVAVAKRRRRWLLLPRPPAPAVGE